VRLRLLSAVSLESTSFDCLVIIFVYFADFPFHCGRLEAGAQKVQCIEKIHMKHWQFNYNRVKLKAMNKALQLNDIFAKIKWQMKHC
jgi:hypothetical protein